MHPSFYSLTDEKNKHVPHIYNHITRQTNILDTRVKKLQVVGKVVSCEDNYQSEPCYLHQNN